MDTELLERKFERMGARLNVRALPPGSARRDVAIDVRHDRSGEYFDVLVPTRGNLQLDVLDVQPHQRHLLLMVKTPAQPGSRTVSLKQKFLCGHDERAWFVAAIPEAAGASNVRTAMEALKPPAVHESQAANRVRGRHRNRRKNRGFVRQGEWFFIPCPTMTVDPALVLHNEPLQRSGNKAHWAELAYRTGGQTVYVSHAHPSGLNAEQYRSIVARNREARKSFRVMQRDAAVYVKGRISHPDHKTIVLQFWHRVMPNTETQARAMRSVVFLD